MSKKNIREPWKVLDKFRGEYFTGTWPTLVQLFKITESRYGSRMAFKAFSPKVLELNYSQVLQKIQILAKEFKKQGIVKGDKIAVTGKNSPEWAISYLAALFAGAIVVPLDVMYTKEEVEKFTSFAGCKILCADLDKIDFSDSLIKYSLEEPHDKYVLSFNDDSSITLEDNLNEEDLAALLFTSGTTGVPKAVMLTHKNLVSDCFLAQSQLTIYPEDVFYAILPLHHSYTMLAVFIESISVGSGLIFGKKLIISQVFKEMREGKVTMFLGVPMLFNKLISALMKGIREKGIIVYGLIKFLMGFSGFVKKVFGKNIGKKLFKGILAKLSLDNNRICISGGGPLPASTFKMFNQLGIDFVQGYGLTETSPIVALNPIEAYIESSVGKVIADTQMKIVNPDEKGYGEIHIKGPMVMKGYYKNQEATDEILSEDGWLNSGDMGYLDKNNYLYLTGRKRNIIVTDGGKNVFPEEIEDKFQLFEEIDQLCVLGYLTDKKTKAEGIRIIIKPTDAYLDTLKKDYDNEALLNEALQAKMQDIVNTVNKELLAYKKITKLLVVKETLAMTSTKKIKRFEVAKKYPQE